MENKIHQILTIHLRPVARLLPVVGDSNYHDVQGLSTGSSKHLVAPSYLGEKEVDTFGAEAPNFRRRSAELSALLTLAGATVYGGGTC
jgi:hypothetical protein